MHGNLIVAEQVTADGMPTVWIERQSIDSVLRALRDETTPRFEMLFDLTAIDERLRSNRAGQPDSEFTVVYHLMSFSGNCDFRIKVALQDKDLSIPSIVRLWPNANWYEREAWDMFGIQFDGHPNLCRIVLPPTWKGHALRKEHPARATEMEPFTLDDDQLDYEQEALKFKPEDWGMKRESENSEFMFLNLGPNHPSVHGAFRIALQLDGEIVVDAVPDIGYHHRGAEKMGERQSWHTYIPYTDRIDYLGGVLNNLPYVMAVEKMAGIEVPERVKVIRVMLCEMFRICSHLLFYGTFAQDVALSDFLHVCRTRTYLQHHRIHLWRTYASGLVSNRWCSTGLTEWLGEAHSGTVGLHASKTRRIRLHGNEQRHPEETYSGRRCV